jgi:hypothetical protein
MRRAAAALLSALASCALEAPPAATQRPIVAGTRDEGDPAVVALLGQDLCTGTLIHSRVVATSAHCIGGDSPEAVFFGTDVREGGTRIDVVERVVHPAWNPDTLVFDVALLLLAEAAEAPPVRLNDRALDSSDVFADVRLVGFGDTGPSNDERGVKRQVVSVVTEVDSTALYYGGTPAQSCFGDSGGPAFLTFGGEEVLAGITSYGDPECAIFGAALRVDAVLNDFIRPYLEMHPCAGDGVCRPECAGTDPDCGATGELATGQACGAHDDCASGLCIGAVEDPALRYCSVSCSSDFACPFVLAAQMRCTPTDQPSLSVCAWPAPTPGAVGSACGDESLCAYDVCVPTDDRGRICSKPCVADGAGDCPIGYACQADELAGDAWFCVPAGPGGGCSVGGRGNGIGIAIALCYILARLHGQKAHRDPDRGR